MIDKLGRGEVELISSGEVVIKIYVQENSISWGVLLGEKWDGTHFARPCQIF